MRYLAFFTMVGVLVAGCTGQTSPEPSRSPSATPSRTSAPAQLEVARIVEDVDHLAGNIGPRHATSDAHRQAAAWVAARFTALGYDVECQEFDVPGGTSWGVPVDAGTSVNVIAVPRGFDPSAMHSVVGAHLDTVPQAPGAEDNASGVATMLEVARLVADQQLPVRFVAFGAEEPRGPGDDDHHYGSRHYVAQLDEPARAATTAMVALDRVGVAAAEVPICHGGRGSASVRDALVASAVASGIAHRACGDNRTSDHWSFERDGLPAARIGSVPFEGYHSAGDVPDVVSADQLESAAVIVLGWLGHPVGDH